MAKSPQSKKTPIADTERLKRFKAMAEETGADADAEAFDRAFAKVVKPHKPKD